MKKLTIIILILLLVIYSSCVSIWKAPIFKKEILISPAIEDEITLNITEYVKGKRKSAFYFCIPHKTKDNLKFMEGFCLFKEKGSDIQTKHELIFISKGTCSTSGELTKAKVLLDIKDTASNVKLKSGHYYFSFTITIKGIEHKVTADLKLDYKTNVQTGIPIFQWKM